MSLILSGSDGVSDIDGSASTPAIRGTDTNTGIFFPAADTIAFGEGGAEAARIDSSSNLLVGSSTSAGSSIRLQIYDNSNSGQIALMRDAGGQRGTLLYGRLNSGTFQETARIGCDSDSASPNNGILYFWTSNASGTSTERARITSGGDLLVGKTATTFSTAGSVLYSSGQIYSTVSGDDNIAVNRLVNDGNLIRFFQASTEEGNISVSGTTVSYNGGNLSRWAQMPGTKDDTLVKGTVMSNLDEMNVYTDAEGNPVDNEQLNKVKVSDVEGDVNVAGVFVNWTYDDAHQVDEINMAMTGDMIIRIAQGVVVQKGDLLMSAGDGTAKPQGDDIVRSKTVAKVTSNHVTCTYADGSYCVPCVLMAC